MSDLKQQVWQDHGTWLLSLRCEGASGEVCTYSPGNGSSAGQAVPSSPPDPNIMVEGLRQEMEAKPRCFGERGTEVTTGSGSSFSQPEDSEERPFSPILTTPCENEMVTLEKEVPEHASSCVQGLLLLAKGSGANPEISEKENPPQEDEKVMREAIEQDGDPKEQCSQTSTIADPSSPVLVPKRVVMVETDHRREILAASRCDINQQIVEDTTSVLPATIESTEKEEKANFGSGMQSSAARHKPDAEEDTTDDDNPPAEAGCLVSAKTMTPSDSENPLLSQDNSKSVRGETSASFSRDGDSAPLSAASQASHEEDEWLRQASETLRSCAVPSHRIDRGDGGDAAQESDYSVGQDGDEEHGGATVSCTQPSFEKQVGFEETMSQRFVGPWLLKDNPQRYGGLDAGKRTAFLPLTAPREKHGFLDDFVFSVRLDDSYPARWLSDVVENEGTEERFPSPPKNLPETDEQTAGDAKQQSNLDDSDDASEDSANGQREPTMGPKGRTFKNGTEVKLQEDEAMDLLDEDLFSPSRNPQRDVGRAVEVLVTDPEEDLKVWQRGVIFQHVRKEIYRVKLFPHKDTEWKPGQKPVTIDFEEVFVRNAKSKGSTDASRKRLCTRPSHHKKTDSTKSSAAERSRHSLRLQGRDSRTGTKLRTGPSSSHRRTLGQSNRTAPNPPPTVDKRPKHNQKPQEGDHNSKLTTAAENSSISQSAPDQQAATKALTSPTAPGQSPAAHSNAASAVANRSRKLTAEQAVEVYGLKGKESSAAVGRMYGLCGASVRFIWQGTAYADVTRHVREAELLKGSENAVAAKGMSSHDPNRDTHALTSAGGDSSLRTGAGDGTAGSDGMISGKDDNGDGKRMDISEGSASLNLKSASTADMEERSSGAPNLSGAGQGLGGDTSSDEAAEVAAGAEGGVQSTTNAQSTASHVAPLGARLDAEETSLLLSLLLVDESLAQYCHQVEGFVNSSCAPSPFDLSPTSLIRSSTEETAYLSSLLNSDPTFAEYCQSVEEYLAATKGAPRE